MNRFCTVVNCMDGRVQLPAIQFLLTRFQASYVDSITEPGPNRILAERSDSVTVDAIERRLRISVEGHRSVGIALVGHHDCAGNPAARDVQNRQTAAGVACLRSLFPSVPVLGLWIDESWAVHELDG